MALDTAKIGADLKKIPWWGWAGAGGAVLAGVYYVRHRTSSQASTAASQVSQSAIPAGLNAADLAGLPFDYTDYNAEYPPDTSGTTGTTPTPTPAPAPAPTPTPSPAPSPAPSPPAVQPIGPERPRPPAPPTPTPTPAPQEQSVDVQPWPAWDSTLSGISSHYGMTWQQLYTYDNNKATIDELAHEHGHYGDEYNWLFPGEVVHVP